MKTKILKSGKNINLVFEANNINPFGVFVIENKAGNMLFNTMDESEAVRKFEEIENIDKI